MRKNLNAVVSPDRVISLVFIAVGVIGFLNTLSGDWKAGPGFGAKLFPQLTFFLMVVCGCLLMLPKPSGKDRLFDWTDGKSLLLLIGTGFLYFTMVRTVGLVVSTFLYSAALFAVFTPSPFRNWKRVVLPALIATAVVWLMFSTLVTIILPTTLLF